MAKALTAFCRRSPVLCILISMRQLSLLLAGLVCASAPAVAQVTVDLHALDALQGPGTPTQKAPARRAPPKTAPRPQAATQPTTPSPQEPAASTGAASQAPGTSQPAPAPPPLPAAPPPTI